MDESLESFLPVDPGYKLLPHQQEMLDLLKARPPRATWYGMSFAALSMPAGLLHGIKKGVIVSMDLETRHQAMGTSLEQILKRNPASSVYGPTVVGEPFEYPPLHQLVYEPHHPAQEHDFISWYQRRHQPWAQMAHHFGVKVKFDKASLKPVQQGPHFTRTPSWTALARIYRGLH